MMNKKVKTYKELEWAIAELKEDKAKHEELLKQNLEDIKEELKPINILKSILKGVAKDKSLHYDALKAGLGIASEYAIGKFFKSNKSPVRHFVANMFEKLVTNFSK